MQIQSFDEFVKLGVGGKRTPLRVRMPADLDTPVSAFLKLRPHGAAFLLESVEQGVRRGRYSFIGVQPHTSVKLRGENVEIDERGDSRCVRVDPEDPFSLIREKLAESGNLVGEHLPAPFASAVGYISYDMVRYFERLPDPKRDELGLPDYHFLFPSTLVAFDHVKNEMEILTLPHEGDPRGEYESAAAHLCSLVDALEAALPTDSRAGLLEAEASPQASDPPISNMTRASHEERVLLAREHIFAGDAFQIVLSQRLRGQTKAPPFQIYRALRILNPSPYMFFIDFGDYQLVGSSPEVLVKVEERTATLCPIAGTRPRGKTSDADADLESELRSNEKECAEHVMLVDLGRNDLGRVCEVGTVATGSLMHVEKYSHVMHLVSEITGTLRSDLDMFDLLRATFPAGTVSGAPKVRAMEIINDLEDDKRGPYAGAVGYFGRQGDMDMCITIRTLIMKGDEYFAQAGGGIVADSDPASEFEETLNKIQAVLKAVSAAEEGL